METNNRNSNSHLEGEKRNTEKILEEKNTDNLFKLMKDVRLPLKDTKEQSRRNKWKKNFLIWIYYSDFLRLLKTKEGHLSGLVG